MSFEIVIEPVPQGEIYTEEPEFMLALADQRVKVGDSLAYNLGA